MTSRTSDVGRAAARMGLATAVSRALGAVRVLVIAAVLGTTALGDTFQSSNSVSNVLFELLAAGALSAVLVPTFVGLLEHDGQPDAETVAGRVLGLAVAAMAMVAVVGVVLAPQIAGLLASAVDDPAVAARREELATVLLRFFVPQVVLYAVGTVATAVLHARNRFTAAAVAPIGNTVVLVAAMVLFRAMAGPDAGLDLSTAEQVVLGLGGTLGVAAFVGIPFVALLASGFRLRPRLAGAWADRRVRSLLNLSGWAALQHAGAGLLLAAALIVGGGVAGGVVAYQVAYVVFLTPFGVLAQPIMTTVLPVMASDAAAGDHAGVGRSLAWALDAMAAVTLPVSAACVALSTPVMTVLAFGRASDGSGIELLAAALASLAAGLFPYGAFLLLARAWYALGDSRTPAIAALVSSGVGVAVMVAAGAATSGSARLLVLGGAHSLTFLLGALWLAARLRPVVGRGAVPALAIGRDTVLAAAAAAGAWLLVRAWDPGGRLSTLVALAAVCGVAGGAYALALRSAGGWPRRAPAGGLA
jgi:putative peptidoglycan lipid II flippase